MKMQHPAIIAAALAALLAGCTTDPQRLTIRDARANDADLLVTVRPEAWGRREGRGPARGFEAGYQQFKADGPQTLASGEAVVVRGTAINGPDVLLQTAKVAAWHFGFTDRFYFGPAFELDLGVGGMRLDVDYTLRPQSGITGVEPFARSRTLPYGALTPRWRFSSLAAIEARLATAGLTDDGEHRKIDAALVLSPLPQLSLRLGYSDRRVRVRAWDTAFSDVDVTIRARGPMAGLRIDF
jgi:hypothetical protein